jgi:lipocalin-like protein
MPPQQPGGPLDVVDDALNLCAHDRDLSIRPRRRNRYAQAMTDMRERLIGTWKLVSVSREAIQADKTDFFGPDPVGYINYGRDGRMMVVIVRGDRRRPEGTNITSSEAEALFRSMVSYAGTYSIEGDEIIHHVEISWNQNWSGTQQRRLVRFEQDRLSLSTHPSPDPIDGKLGVRRMVWERPKK